MNIFGSISRTIQQLAGNELNDSVIKVDPLTGLSEFPPPGEERYRQLPIFVDPDGEVLVSVTDQDKQQYWMPDKFCKVCFACEDTFTMYRRRHHCRICGQIFCNPCSSFYVDGEHINLSGSVRACALCHKHYVDQYTNENKLLNIKRSGNEIGRKESLDNGPVDPRKTFIRARMNEFNLASILTPLFLAGEITKSDNLFPAVVPMIRRTAFSSELIDEKREHLNNLQYRAGLHIQQMVKYLLSLESKIVDKESWETIIVSLINSVVANVDPNVKNGDRLDIRPYVKVKSIPGGSISECAYVEGVVFRKNVAHKKMVYNKDKPKILLLSGGIEFQRQDYRLSSLDTLLEQEDKYLEILVQKIMSLEPDILIVGKSVSRRAQDLLISHKVVVFQHVKYQVLERIARVTRALLLPSTDHMIQQYGSECLGSCGTFRLQQVVDSAVAEATIKMLVPGTNHQRITNAVFGTTYVYMDGCSPDLGCTLVLRGAQTAELKIIKSIIKFCVMVAYHLRLEVAFYANRCIQLPSTPDATEYCDDSDGEESSGDYKELLTDNSDFGNTKVNDFVKEQLSISGRFKRFLLSQSLDVDFGLPYRTDLKNVGLPVTKMSSLHPALDRPNPMDFQGLSVASLLMIEGKTQRGKPEEKLIKFYTEHDVTLGQFLIESCFHVHGVSAGSKNIMLDHTLSFVHRTGRIDIAVCKVDGVGNDFSSSNGAQSSQSIGGVGAVERDSSDYLKNTQVKMTSYCKVCKALVTPDVPMSDESWKMSFGKFLELSFYNRSARCRTGGCDHCVRDDHILFFSCEEGYIARFEFLPLHPLALSIRQKLGIPMSFHVSHSAHAVERLFRIKTSLFDEFKMNLSALERETREQLSMRPFILALALNDISSLRNTVNHFGLVMSEDLVQLAREILSKSAAIIFAGDESLSIESLKLICFDAADGMKVAELPSTPDRSSTSAISRHKQKTDLASMDTEFSVIPSTSVDNNAASHVLGSIQSRFPSVFKREMFVRFIMWNRNMKKIQEYVDVIRTRLAQAQLNAQAVLSEPAGAGSNSSVDDEDLKAVRETIMSEPIVIPFEHNHVDLHGNEGDFGILDGAFDGIGDAAVAVVAAVGELGAAMKLAGADLVSDSVTSEEKADQSLKTANIDLPAESNDDKNVNPATDEDDKMESISIQIEVDSRLNNVLSHRIPKAFHRFLGKENSSQANKQSDWVDGRLGLPPGRKGIVLEVHDDELATVIAYSLASLEYSERIQEFLKDEGLHDATVSISGGAASGKDSTGVATAGDEVAGAMTRVESRGNLQGGLDDDEHDDEFTDAHFGLDSYPTGLGAAFDDGGAAHPNVITEIDAEDTVYSVSVLKQPQSESNKLDTDRSVTGSRVSENGPETSNIPDPKNLESRGPTLLNNTAKYQSIERRLLSQRKSHIKHRFIDCDEKENVLCKFICHSFWAVQFEALRALYLDEDGDEGFIRSLAASAKWQAQGGKSGASFSKSSDERFVVKYITRTELQMFLDFAPAYFEYMQKVFFLGLPTVLCKVLGVYQIGFHNRVTGKKVMEQLVVMENLLFERNITRIFDLKGSSRVRYVNTDEKGSESFDELILQRRKAKREGKPVARRPLATQVLMDYNVIELTNGKPLPLRSKGNTRFQKAVLNDTLFLSIINVVDYSILVGVDENSEEVVVGIIDYLRQYDIIKRMERMGKSVGMIAGQAEPTVIQPSQYRKRFVTAMDRYFMPVPDKWNTTSSK